MDHWVRISDEDLAFIQDLDPAGFGDVHDIIADIKDIIEDGLETA